MGELIAISLAAGIALGYAGRGRLRNLPLVGLRHNWILVVGVLGVALQNVFGEELGAGARAVASAFNLAVVAVWLALNASGRRGLVRAGVAVAGLGWALNALVMIPNGGMPVSLHALRDAGASASFDVRDGNLYRHVPAEPGTLFRPLGDVIPLTSLRSVISIGDIGLLAGISLVIAGGMRSAGDDGAAGKGGSAEEAAGSDRAHPGNR